jgi:hypothetical protein
MPKHAAACGYVQKIQRASICSASTDLKGDLPIGTHGINIVQRAPYSACNDDEKAEMYTLLKWKRVCDGRIVKQLKKQGGSIPAMRAGICKAERGEGLWNETTKQRFKYRRYSTPCSVSQHLQRSTTTSSNSSPIFLIHIRNRLASFRIPCASQDVLSFPYERRFCFRNTPDW